MIRLVSTVATLLVSQAALAAPVPADLQPPAATTLAAKLRAEGAQIYACPGGSAWMLEAPEATLTDDGGTMRVRHYAGPAWEASDGSKIIGKLVAKRPSPTNGAIPWLLLSAIASGSGLLEGVRYIQRLDTEGGEAPAGSCTVGTKLRVPYKATYVFFR